MGLKRSDVIDLISSFIKFINVEFCGAIFCFISFMSENSEIVKKKREAELTKTATLVIKSIKKNVVRKSRVKSVLSLLPFGLPTTVILLLHGP